MVYLAYIFAAFCLVNGIPHFIKGVCGDRFQSPFAKPPGVGESTPVTNVLWGSFNFLICFLVLNFAGLFEIGRNTETHVFVAALFVSAIILAVTFGRIRNRKPRKP